MKSYKVLEAHQGDRAYAPGDTRIADPNVVGHLVGLGLLEEGVDVPDEPDFAAAPGDRAQIEVLTAERDDARAELETHRQLLTSGRDDLAKARQQVVDLTKELEAARKAAKPSTKAAS